MLVNYHSLKMSVVLGAALLFSLPLFAETKVYGKLHLALKTEEGHASRLSDQASYVGFKYVTPLNDVLNMKVQAEFGANHSIIGQVTHQAPIIRQLHVNLKGRLGEVRLGRHEQAYDMVDNALQSYLSSHANGLITRNHPAELFGYVTRKGNIGVFATLSPKNKNHKTRSSVMLNYASGSFYAGVAAIHEPALAHQGGKLVVNYKGHHKGKKFGVGAILEKCPSTPYATATSTADGSCTIQGGDIVQNISALYYFGQPYVAAQWAKNTTTGVKQQTIEVGQAVGKHSKAYLSLDQRDKTQTVSLGWMSTIQ